MGSGTHDDHGDLEEEHPPCSDEGDYETEDDGSSYSEEDDDGYSSDDNDKNGSHGSDLKQHLFAAIGAILAAVVAHAHVHGGGYDAWRTELARDWSAFRSGGAPPTLGAANSPSPSSLGGDSSTYASAPSMDAIPISKRRRALERALGGGGEAGARGNNDGRASSPLGRGHEKARNHRRTRGLTFCPENGSVAGSSTADNDDNLVELEFILPLDPGVRVLHSYYLADALGTASGMVYEESKDYRDVVTADLGSYANDAIVKDIDALVDAADGEGLMMEEVRSIVASRLPAPLVDRQHLCLLHQYALNRSSGRSIRGTTRVYERPHVSTYYRSGNKHQRRGKLAGAEEPDRKVLEASLTFTGYAAKFVNLSPEPLDLYWDGGGEEMRKVLVGTIPSMGSIGTASFPGHSFYLAPTYDRNHQLQRWAITEDEPILYYDPVLGDLSAEEQRTEMERLTMSGTWTEKRRFEREAWMVDRSFGRDYLVKTGRVWLANFPQPYLDVGVESNGNHSNSGLDASFTNSNKEVEPVQNDGHKLHMWPADYIGQTHTLDTSNLYFTTLPKTLERLTTADYLPEMEEERRLEMRQFQSSSPKGKKKAGDNQNATQMPLNAKVVSVAPRVLEVRKFLSPVEVQHLIGLASGAKGNVSMMRSTVSASNAKSAGGDRDTNERTSNGHVADARSSTGGWIHREQDVVVDAIFRRIADLLNVDEGLMRDTIPGEGEEEPSVPTHDRIVEAMQLLRYGPGEEYAPHHDFTYPSIDDRYQPKRYATVLMYLTGEGDIVEDGVLRRGSTSDDNAVVQSNSDGLQGGETIFPRAITTNFHDGVRVEPQSGKAVLLYNVLPDGNMDDLSQHAGGKVEKGVKYVANVWIWDPIVN